NREFDDPCVKGLAAPSRRVIEVKDFAPWDFNSVLPFASWRRPAAYHLGTVCSFSRKNLLEYASKSSAPLLSKSRAKDAYESIMHNDWGDQSARQPPALRTGWQTRLWPSILASRWPLQPCVAPLDTNTFSHTSPAD